MGTAASNVASGSSDDPPAEEIDGEPDDADDTPGIEEEEEEEEDEEEEAAAGTKGGDGGAGADLEKGQNPRFYTPRECARIMGFPDSFVVDDVCKAENRVYHQLGNAVCPLVIEALGKSIVDTGVFEG